MTATAAMPSLDQRQVRAGLALAAMRPCVMCLERADGAGMFLPNDPLSWGGKPGKARALFYALCSRCERETTPEEREQRFWQMRPTTT